MKSACITAGGFGLGLFVMACLIPKPETITEVIYVQDESKVVLYEGILEEALGVVPQHVYSIPVTVTAYSARRAETNSEPWWTADMTLSRVGILAVSRDILNELGLEYGQTVILGNYGVFKVHDTMNKRFTRRVDILMANQKAALKFGLKKDIKLTWFNKE
jgi:3D (Asp-Asp-Asp) domain-containing protein